MQCADSAPRMGGDKTNRKLETDLAEMLEPAFPGLSVTVELSERWQRPCATFVWSGFAGLLPEERFHRLVQAIPASFRTKRMGSVVWVELSPGETVDSFLKLPRSEDVAPKEATIYAGLCKAKFFDALRASMGRSPRESCSGGFVATDAVLAEKKYSAARATEAKLLFIRHGVYCDCQVLETVQPALAKLYAGAA